MSEEMVEMFSGMRQATRERHAEWKVANMAVVKASGLRYRPSNKGECLTFRLGDVVANFYPSTGRWRAGNQTYGGGADKFIAWLERNK